MDLGLVVRGENPDSLVRDLHTWLAQEDGPWGPIRVSEREPPPGKLGPIADTIQVALGSVSTASSLATVIIAWLQYRKPDVSITLRLDRRESQEVSARQAQADYDAACAELVQWLTEELESPPAVQGGADDAR